MKNDDCHDCAVENTFLKNNHKHFSHIRSKYYIELSSLLLVLPTLTHERNCAANLWLKSKVIERTDNNDNSRL